MSTLPETLRAPAVPGDYICVACNRVINGVDFPAKTRKGTFNSLGLSASGAGVDMQSRGPICPNGHKAWDWVGAYQVPAGTIRFFLDGIGRFALLLWFIEGFTPTIVALVVLALMCALFVELSIRVRRMERTGEPAALVAPARRVFMRGNAIAICLFALFLILRKW